jgi:membrane-bound inhibitor of C-type lysozyme
MRLVLAAAAAAVLVSACSTTSGGDAAASASQTYRCDNGKTVTAVYDNSGPAARATVTVDGRSYVLTVARSASGARYTSEQGPTPDKLFTWWTRGAEATWRESPLDHTAAANETIVATCTAG